MPKAVTSSPVLRNISLDALKGLAIVSVVFTHCVGGSLPGIWGPIGRMGQNGVQLFFVISAFLAFQSLNRWFGSPDTVTVSGALHWICLRLFKIIPIYYLSLALTLLIQGLGPRYWMGASATGVTKENLLFHLLFLHGLVPQYNNSILSVEWYLGALALFYLAAPFLYRVISNAGRALWLFVLSLFLVRLIPYLFLNPLPESDIYVWEAYINNLSFGPQLPVLCLGILLYFLFPKILEEQGSFTMGFGLLVIAILLLAGQIYNQNSLFLCSESTIFGIIFLILICSQLISPCILLVNPLLCELGRLSLPIYLFHMLFMTYYEVATPVILGNYLDCLLKFAAILTISAIWGYLVIRWYDKPIYQFMTKRNQKS